MKFFVQNTMENKPRIPDIMDILTGKVDAKSFFREIKKANPNMNRKKITERLLCLLGPIDQNCEGIRLFTVLKRCFEHIRTASESIHDKEIFLGYVLDFCKGKCPMNVQFVIDIMYGNVDVDIFGIAENTDRNYLNNLSDSLYKFLENGIAENSFNLDIVECTKYLYNLAMINKKKDDRHMKLIEFGFEFSTNAPFKSFHKRFEFVEAFHDKAFGKYMKYAI